MVPPALQELLDRAGEAVARDPHHDLLFVHRLAIYTYFGPADFLLGRYRRGQLGVIAAAHVRPVWATARPDDPLAERVLQVARQALATDVLTDEIVQAAIEQAIEAWRWMETFLDRYDFLEYLRHNKREAQLKPLAEHVPQPALWALGAGIAAVWTTIGKDRANSLMPEANLQRLLRAATTNEIVTRFDAEAAQFASFAVAGCPWQGDHDDAERLRFWTWWLREAVPAAWESRTFAQPFPDLRDCLRAARTAREQLSLVVEELRVRIEHEPVLQQQLDEDLLNPTDLSLRLEQDRQEVSTMVRISERLIDDLDLACEQTARDYSGPHDLDAKRG